MAKLIWTCEYSVGVEEMDRQHQKLFDLINRLYEALGRDSDNDVVIEVIDDMAEYTRMHFLSEEYLLSDNDYPDFDSQKQQHGDFIAKVDAFKDDVIYGKPLVTADVMSYLESWWKRHIMEEDKKYGKYLSEKGVGGTGGSVSY